VHELNNLINASEQNAYERFKQEMDQMDQEEEILRVQLRGTLLDLLRQLENFNSDGLDAAVQLDN